MKTPEYSIAKSKDTTPAYRRYAGKVHRLSHKIYENNLDVLNPNSYNRTLCGVEDGYQLDHIISIKYGFDNNIPPETLSRIDNLRLIPWKDNLLKGSHVLGE
jgi:5-methylcytosine-specific restriction endonuclease McrA